MVATQSTLISVIQSSVGKPVHLIVARGHHLLSLTATPQRSSASNLGYLGIKFDTPEYLGHPGIQESVVGSWSLIGQVTGATLSAFGSAFSPSGLSSLANQVASSKDAATVAASGGTQTRSFLGALELGVDAAHAGALPFLGLLISLNISLGILNMLPMLPLDGGHVAIALYERARTRRGRARYRADVSKLMPVVYAFLAFLVLFVAGKMYLDVAHGVPNPFH